MTSIGTVQTTIASTSTTPAQYAISNRTPSLYAGQKFINWDWAFVAIVDDCLHQAHASPRTVERCPIRAIYRCSDDDCDYRVYISLDSHYEKRKRRRGAQEEEDEGGGDGGGVGGIGGDDDEAVSVRTVQGLHRCEYKEELPPRLGIFSTRYLRTKYGQTPHLHGQLSGAQLANFAQSSTGVKLPYKTVYKLKQSLAAIAAESDRSAEGCERSTSVVAGGLQSRSGGWNDTLDWVPFYMQRLDKVDPKGLHEIIRDKSYNVKACFISPHSSQIAWPHCRPFISITSHSTLPPTAHPTEPTYTLMTASGIDANDQPLLWAWAYCDQESVEVWTWFLSRLKRSLEECNHTDVVLLSNRENGLGQAISSVFDKATEYMCIQNIKENINRDYGERAMKSFVQVIHKETAEEYETALNQLRATYGEQLYNHIVSLDTDKFVKHKTKISRYGRYVTTPVCAHPCERNSNTTDKILGIGMNFDDDLDPNYRRILHLLEEVWDDQMSLRPYRLKASQSNHRFTPAAEHNLLINKEQAMGYRFKARESINSDTEINGEVISRFPGVNGVVDKRIVKIWPMRRMGWCSCLEYREMGYPCCHAIKAILENDLEVDDFVPPWYLTKTWQSTYSEPMAIVLIDDLAGYYPPSTSSSTTTNLTIETTTKRRRKQKEINQNLSITDIGPIQLLETQLPAPDFLPTGAGNGYQVKGTNTCKKCGKRGHNKRTCPVERALRGLGDFPDDYVPEGSGVLDSGVEDGRGEGELNGVLVALEAGHLEDGSDPVINPDSAVVISNRPGGQVTSTISSHQTSGHTNPRGTGRPRGRPRGQHSSSSQSSRRPPPQHQPLIHSEERLFTPLDTHHLPYPAAESRIDEVHPQSQARLVHNYDLSGQTSGHEMRLLGGEGQRSQDRSQSYGDGHHDDTHDDTSSRWGNVQPTCYAGRDERQSWW